MPMLIEIGKIKEQNEMIVFKMPEMDSFIVKQIRKIDILFRYFSR